MRDDPYSHVREGTAEDPADPLSDGGAAVEMEDQLEKAGRFASGSVPAFGVPQLPSPAWFDFDLLDGKAGRQCCAQTVGTRVR